MTQAEIEAELISVRQQLSQLQTQRANEKAYWRPLGIMSLVIAFLFCFAPLAGRWVGSNSNEPFTFLPVLSLLFIGLALIGDPRKGAK